MAIANMKFVKVIGLLSELDAFLGSCCVDGTFQPEQAMQYICLLYTSDAADE